MHSLKHQLIKSQKEKSNSKQSNLIKQLQKKLDSNQPQSQCKSEQKKIYCKKNESNKLFKQKRIESSQFAKNYLKFCKQNQNMNSNLLLKNYLWATNNLQILQTLFKEVNLRGGFIKVTSEGLFQQISKKISEQFQLNKQSKKLQLELFEIYKLYLVKYEFNSNQLTKNFNFSQLKLETSSFVNRQQLYNILQETPNDMQIYKSDVIVFKNGQDCLNIETKIFNLETFQKQFKNMIVDIRIQSPLQLGFNIKKNNSSKMKVKHFKAYQKLCNNLNTSDFKMLPKEKWHLDLFKQFENVKIEGVDFIKRLKYGEIFFAVNIDLQQNNHFLQKLKRNLSDSFFSYQNKSDLLSYLSSNILGCSLPQFYMKVHNVWTGGHQQNLNMIAININFGPASAEWLTLQEKYIQSLRKLVKQQHNIDILNCQGNWFQDVDWFIKHNFPIKRLIQHQKDIVLIGPGTLHWVRSQGVNLQCAWNTFPIEINQFKVAFCRQNINKEINFKYSNIVPLKSLTIKVLNHEAHLMSQELKTLLLNNIQRWYREESQVLWKIRSRVNIKFESLQIFLQQLEEASSFCELCKQQILIFFGDGSNDSQIRCLQCLQKQMKEVRAIYSKYYQTDLNTLIQNCRKNSHNQQIQRLCQGQNYIGSYFKCSVRLKQSQEVKKNQQILISSNLHQIFTSSNFDMRSKNNNQNNNQNNHNQQKNSQISKPLNFNPNFQTPKSFKLTQNQTSNIVSAKNEKIKPSNQQQNQQNYAFQIKQLSKINERKKQLSKLLKKLNKQQQRYFQSKENIGLKLLNQKYKYQQKISKRQRKSYKLLQKKKCQRSKKYVSQLDNQKIGYKCVINVQSSEDQPDLVTQEIEFYYDKNKKNKIK